MKIAILPLCAVSLTERTVRSLPFGNEEQKRLLAIRNPARATQSFGARVALHSLTKEAFPIRYTSHGKPYFDAPNAPAISLAHTDALSVAALASDGEGNVGVDLEELRPFPNKERIANRFFGADELATLAAVPTEETFFKLWTAKEATAKLHGGGLASMAENHAPCVPYTRHFRVVSDAVESILCIAAEQPLTDLEWHISSPLEICEI